MLSHLLTSLAVCLALLVIPSSSQQLTIPIYPSILYSFESPQLGNGGYSYNPANTTQQPFVFQATLGGVTAGANSPFAPPAPVTIPDGNQFSFVQTSGNNRVSWMAALLTGLSTSQSYYVTFQIGVRGATQTGEAAGQNTTSTVALTVGSQQLWTSGANFSDPGGWLSVRSSTFIPTTTQLVLNFSVISTSAEDHCILFDSLTVLGPSSTLQLNQTWTFDALLLPATTPVRYQYNHPIGAQQPWTWSDGLGGVAMIGSPFDPPPPTTPPSGNQYAYLQTAPNAAAINQSQLSAYCSGMLPTQSYYISYYWAARAAQNAAGGETEAGNQTQSQLTILVDGVAVYTSQKNLSDSAGWILVQTPSFVPTLAANGRSLITFFDEASSFHDHTLLFDNITVWTGSASAPGAPSSSAGSSAASIPSSSSSSVSRAASSSSSAAAPSTAASSSVVVPPSGSSSSARTSASSSSSSSSAINAAVSSSSSGAASSAASVPASSSSTGATVVRSSSSSSSSTAAVSVATSSVPSSTATSARSSSSSSSSPSAAAVSSSSVPAGAVISSSSTAASDSSTGVPPLNANAATARSAVSALVGMVAAALLAVVLL